jgi:hypothetical protein
MGPRLPSACCGGSNAVWNGSSTTLTRLLLQSAFVLPEYVACRKSDGGEGCRGFARAPLAARWPKYSIEWCQLGFRTPQRPVRPGKQSCTFSTGQAQLAVDRWYPTRASGKPCRAGVLVFRCRHRPSQLVGRIPQRFLEFFVAHTFPGSIPALYFLSLRRRRW